MTRTSITERLALSNASKNTKRGLAFEASMFSWLDARYGKAFMVSTSTDNTRHGTDCYIYRQPIDITLSAKSKTGKIKKLGDLYAGLVSVYKRYSNGHVMFPEPVMVLEIHMPISILPVDVVEEAFDLFYGE